MTDALIGTLLSIVPERWRDSVANDLREESRHHGWSRATIAWHALRIAVTLRWRDRGRLASPTGRGLFLNELRQDVVFALRLAASAPLFSLLAIVTLAIGVGANVAVFSVAKAVLLDPLPYADDGRLVRIHGRPLLDPLGRTGLSAGAITDISERQTTLTGVGLFYPATWEVTYRPADGPRVLTAGMFAPGFLETLGVAVSAGRAFRVGETPSAGQFPALLSHEFWQQEFGADPDVVGRTLAVDAYTWEVTGILPRGFTGPMGAPDLWFPLDISSSLADPARARANEFLGAVARLAPDVTLDDASRDLNAVAATLSRQYPDTDGDRTVTIESLRASMVGDTRTPLLVLLGSAALVLLLACANLAGAALSRTLGRRGELAVRVALGAGRGRLVRQLLTESLVLAAAGLALGIALALAGLRAIASLDIPDLPQFADLSLDAGALMFATLIAGATGIAIGVAPALTAARANTQAVLRASARSLSEGRRPGRWRGALLAGQIALCVTLLAGASLLTRSLIEMAKAPLGFDPGQVLTLAVKGPIPETDAGRKQFFAAFEDRIRALPGVVAVANTSSLPDSGTIRRALDVDGATTPAGTAPPRVPFVTVSDDWFRTMRIPVVEGRAFGSQDTDGSPHAVVISQQLARTYWPDGGAIGARIRLGDDPSTPWSEVIGVAGDVRTGPARLEPDPVVYASARQSLMRETRLYAVRTAGAPLASVGAIREALLQLDRTVPMSDVASLDAILDARLAVHRLPALLMGTFALLALLLGAVGIYALTGNLAAAREREFSLRLALGSRPSEIGWLLLRDGTGWTLLGLAIGAVGIGLVGAAVQDLLYRVPPRDPGAIAVAVAAVIAAGAIALVAPLRRVLRLDAASGLH